MTQNENLTENISTPRTRKSNELSGLNRYNYQNIAMTQNEKCYANVSTPRTQKLNKLSGLNSHYYQNMIVMSNNIETNRPQRGWGNFIEKRPRVMVTKEKMDLKESRISAKQEQALQTGNKSVQDGNFERWNITK